MKKPFKFRYVNEVVGAFVLLTVLLVIAAVIFVGVAQEWFVQKHVVHVRFPKQGTAGLTKDATIEIMETTAGKLEKIVINDDGSMVGIITITGEFIRFVRSDSEAIIKKRFAIAGDSYIEITRGTGTVLTADNPFIHCRKDSDVTEVIQNIVLQLEESIFPLLLQVQQTLAAYETVAKSVVDPEGAIQQMLRSIQRLIDDVGQGKGAAGLLLQDPETAQDIEEIIQSLNELSKELVKMGENVTKITGTVEQTASNQLPDLSREATETIEEARRLIEGIQKHWLLRGSMGTPESPRRLPSAELQPVKEAMP